MSYILTHSKGMKTLASNQPYTKSSQTGNTLSVTNGDDVP